MTDLPQPRDAAEFAIWCEASRARLEARCRRVKYLCSALEWAVYLGVVFAVIGGLLRIGASTCS